MGTVDLLDRLRIDGIDIEPERCEIDSLTDLAETIERRDAFPSWLEDCRAMEGPHGPIRAPRIVAQDLRRVAELLALRERVNAVNACGSHDLGMTMREAGDLRDAIADADLHDIGALAAYDLLHNRAIFGRAW